MVALVRASVLVGERPGREGVLSLGAYADILRSPDLASLIGTTVAFAAGSTVLGLIFGGTLAWCVERTNAPLKHLVYPMIFVSFAVPGILRAIGWIFLLGPRTGTVNEVYRAITGSDAVLLDAYSLPAMILVEGLFWIPLVFLMMSASFRSMDPSLEEASLASGASAWQTVRRVTVAIALPSVFSVVMLTFIRSVQAFEVPLIFGVPGKTYTLTTEVYLSVNAGILPEYSFASAYGVLLVAFLAICIFFYGRLTRRASSFATSLRSIVMLRLVLWWRPMMRSQSVVFSFVSVDLPCIRQWTSRPLTTRVSNSFVSFSRARTCADVGADFRNVRKYVSPVPTENGSTATACRTSAAVRTNVVTSNPNAFSKLTSRRCSSASRAPVASNTTLPLFICVQTWS